MSALYPGGPTLNEFRAYYEVAGDKRFTIFTDPTEADTDLTATWKHSLAIAAAFVEGAGVSHGQVVFEKQPGVDRARLIPEFMAHYERIVAPLQEEAANLSKDERFDLGIFTENAKRRVRQAGRRTLSAFVLFAVGAGQRRGGLFVPEPMMGDEPYSRILGPKIAAHILPTIEEIRERW